jgi:ClpP class serine protease
MAQHETARFAPNGPLALDPKAFGLDFLIGRPDVGPALVADGKAAVVRVCGPLCFSGFLFDTYDAIRGRVRAALASEAECVILQIDSPGGEVAGCFDCARGIRADAEAAKKRLIVFVASQACSAAYALASACSEIWVSDTAVVGSIGVIHEMQSVARADKAAGADFAFVTSGTKKAYGNPHTPLSEEALAETQRTVDATAARFFELVRGWRAFDPEPLQAGVLVGADAVARGLADRVGTFDALVGAIQAPTAQAATSAEASRMDPEKKDQDATRAALVKDSNSDDAKVSSRAKKALAAYDKGDEDEKDDKASKAEAPAASAPAAAKAEDDEKKDDKAIAAASSLAASLAASDARIKALEAAIAAGAARAAAEERATFMASNANLPEALLKSLEGLPLDACKRIVAAVPAQFRSQAITPEVNATLGAHQGEGARAEFMASPLAARMGAKKTELVCVTDPNTNVQQFGLQKVKA